MTRLLGLAIALGACNSAAPSVPDGGAISPYALIAPDLGDGRLVTLLAEGPDHTLLALTTAPPSDSDHELHRIDLDGSLRWSVSVGAASWVGQASETQIVVGGYGDDTLHVFDANGTAMAPVAVGGALAGLVAMPVGGVAGVALTTGGSEAFAFRWSGVGGIQTVAIAPSIGISTAGFLVGDDHQTLWFSGPNDTVTRVAADGGASTLQIGLTRSTGAARAGGGVFAWAIPAVGQGTNGVFEVDPAGVSLGAFAVPTSTWDTYENGSSNVLLRRDDVVVLAQLLSLLLPDHSAVQDHLYLMDVKRGTTKAFDFPPRDQTLLEARARLACGVVIDGSFWFGGWFSGSFQVGTATVNAPSDRFRPLLLRIRDVSAVANL